MIDVTHSGGCGARAFRITGIPIGRGITPGDIVYTARNDDGDEIGTMPNYLELAPKCEGCGEPIDLEAISSELGAGPHPEPEIPAAFRHDEPTEELQGEADD